MLACFFKGCDAVQKETEIGGTPIGLPSTVRLTHFAEESGEMTLELREQFLALKPQDENGCGPATCISLQPDATPPSVLTGQPGSWFLK